eukprot:TRINITY_DN26042_c0_g1_i1.p1 TRINITY_DN26042_c0_g1~~TRINITY_DN26042_c0_g1_i1.p1  ORF type:complete len:236 (+),score=92.50 TRINITY_DN26042_c0_g1_i1:56-763(+)
MAAEADLLVRRAIRQGDAGIELIANALSEHPSALLQLQRTLDAAVAAGLDAPAPSTDGILPQRPTETELAFATEEAVITWLVSCGERSAREAEDDLRSASVLTTAEKEAAFGSLEAAHHALAAQRRQIADMRAVVALTAGRCWRRAHDRLHALDEPVRARMPKPLVAVLDAQREALDEPMPEPEEVTTPPLRSSSRRMRQGASVWRRRGAPLRDVVADSLGWTRKSAPQPDSGAE